VIEQRVAPGTRLVILDGMLRCAAVVSLLIGCVTPSDNDPPVDPPVDPPPVDPSGRIEVTLADLQPGWSVTTSRFAGTQAPGEHTIISDGSPITLAGDDEDVFVATITDASGALVATQSMNAHCAHANARRLDVPREYATIQAAVDAAAPGDTVRVAAGEYSESVHMRAGVCLLGAGAKRTILDAHGGGRTLVDLSDAPGSVVSGFTFRGTAPKVGCANEDVFTCSGNWYTAGIYLGGGALDWDHPTKAAPPIIMNNIFADNYIGVMLYFHGIAVVRNNIFVDNRSGFVANHYQDRTLVANNVFVNNTELAIGNQAAYLDIIDNIIVGSELGIRFMYIQTGHIACNIFYGNGANQSDEHVVPPRFTIGQNGNVEIDPQFLGNGDFHLQPSSPGKGSGCHKTHVVQPASDAPDRGAYGGPLSLAVDL
jgi:hypothetical protein